MAWRLKSGGASATDELKRDGGFCGRGVGFSSAREGRIVSAH
jgi:hypothetical protein